jgi:hypothetical protein
MYTFQVYYRGGMSRGDIQCSDVIQFKLDQPEAARESTPGSRAGTQSCCLIGFRSVIGLRAVGALELEGSKTSSTRTSQNAANLHNLILIFFFYLNDGFRLHWWKYRFIQGV